MLVCCKFSAVWLCGLPTTRSECTRFRYCINEYDQVTRNFYRNYWNLTQIPRDIPRNATGIHLEHNQITSLSAGDFPALEHCTFLDLRYNLISTINPGSFAAVNSLVYLLLSNNKLKVVAPDIFQGLFSLFELSLQENKELSSLNNKSFSGLYSLRFLNLYDTNLTTVHSNLFVNLPRPLQLAFGPSQFKWNCTSLCWLKAEETFNTVHWRDPDPTEEELVPPAVPVCGEETGSWYNLQCSDHGLCFLASKVHFLFSYHHNLTILPPEEMSMLCPRWLSRTRREASCHKNWSCWSLPCRGPGGVCMCQGVHRWWCHLVCGWWDLDTPEQLYHVYCCQSWSVAPAWWVWNMFLLNWITIMRPKVCQSDNIFSLLCSFLQLFSSIQWVFVQSILFARWLSRARRDALCCEVRKCRSPSCRRSGEVRMRGWLHRGRHQLVCCQWDLDSCGSLQQAFCPVVW